MAADDPDTLEDNETPGSVVLPPRENPDLVGHETAEATLIAAWRAGRMPHALLVTGPRGVGKATLAFRLARFLFAAGTQPDPGAPVPQSLALAPTHPVFRLVASGGHLDLLVVERGYDPRRRRLRREIVVGDTRTISGFLRLTAAGGGWRIVIVDGADTMNRNAANAFLKILEEPPEHAVLLLLSENPGRLLPTIRSRCRRLALKPLADDIVAASILRHRPDLAPAEARRVAALAHGSIGAALALATEDGLALYRGIVNLLQQLPEIDGEALHGFADRLARMGGAEDGFTLGARLLGAWLARMVVQAATGAPERWGLPGEAQVMQRLAARCGLDHWIEVWENLGHLFDEADGINLDRKQVVLNAFFALEAAAR